MSRGADRPQARLLLRNRQRRLRVDVSRLRGFLKRASAVAPLGARATVVLLADSPLRALNRTYRGQDRPTDVLSFAARRTPGGEKSYLGDVLISVETARRQAMARGTSLGRELRLLALHGLIHLLGYDHETDNGEMRRLEYRWRKRLRITRPVRRGARR